VGVEMLYAFGLALAAGLWPVGLTAILAYLDHAPPLRNAYAYLAGALVMVGAVTVLAVVGLSALDTAPRHHATLSGGVTLALGVLALAFAVMLWRRAPRPPRRTERHRAGAGGAFLVGFAMWIPSPVYLAALKAIKDTGAGTAEIALSSVLAVVVFLWIIEVPIVCYLIAPAATGRWLGAVNRWLRRNGRAIVVALTAGIGVALTVEGVARLVS
jgi:hypothetical protein